MNPEEEIERISKRIRNLNKKVKEIKELEEKQATQTLSQAQIEKIEKKSKIVKEIDEQQSILDKIEQKRVKLRENPEMMVSSEFVKKMMNIFHIRQMKKAGYLQKMKIMLSEYESDLLDKFFLKLFCVDYSKEKSANEVFNNTAEELDLLFKRSLNKAIDGKSYDFVFRIIHRIQCSLQNNEIELN